MQLAELDPRTEGTEKEQTKNREKGAIIVEATISLSVFMFAIFVLLSLIQIAYVQSRMSVAVCCASKELAQYTHLYYVTGLNNALPGGGGKSSELFNKVGELVTSLGGDIGSIDQELGQYVTDGGNALSGDNLANWIKQGTGGLIVKQLMEKNLVTGSSTSAEEFEKRNRVEEIDFGRSRVLENDEKALFIQATYYVRVIQLLNIDYRFHMSSWGYAVAWGD